MEQVFHRLEISGLKLRATKCEFCKKELLYLGHILSKEGVKVNPKLISAVKNCRPPQTQKEVRTFLGLTSYYRRFVSRYAHEAEPHQRLLRKDTPWAWTEDCQQAFETLKAKLLEPLCSCTPTSRGPSSST